LVRGIETAEPPDAEPGILVTNPFYGERIQHVELEQLYANLGNVLRRKFLGWDAWIFTTPAMVKRIGLRPKSRRPLRNGPIDCRLAHLPISTQPVQRDRS
jgi:23S rRNA G2445 N2-methylase RlmL